MTHSQSLIDGPYFGLPLDFATVLMGCGTTEQPAANDSLSAPSLKVTSGWTKAIVFTKDGTYPPEDPTNPCFKAAPSMKAVQVAKSDRAKFALQQILPPPDITVEHVFIDREITVDGLPGRELMALADDLSTNTPILLYAAVLFEEDSFIALHGWAGQYVDEDWGAEFKAITESFKRK